MPLFLFLVLITHFSSSKHYVNLASNFIQQALTIHWRRMRKRDSDRFNVERQTNGERKRYNDRYKEGQRETEKRREKRDTTIEIERGRERQKN